MKDWGHVHDWRKDGERLDRAGRPRWECYCGDVVHTHRETGPVSGGAPWSLTPREWAVMEAIGEGHGVVWIAGRLGLSTNAVHAYMTRIKVKVGIERRGQTVESIRDAYQDYTICR